MQITLHSSDTVGQFLRKENAAQVLSHVNEIGMEVWENKRSCAHVVSASDRISPGWTQMENSYPENKQSIYSK